MHEGLVRVLRGDGRDVRRALRVQPVEDVREQRLGSVEHLVVVFDDDHLDVEPRELAQVPVRVRVLRAEHGADLEHVAQVALHGHLLVQLRALRKEGRPPHVAYLEDRGPALARRRDDLRRVDLDEALGAEVPAEQPAHSRLDVPDRVVARCAHVQPAVVQPRALADADARRRRPAVVDGRRRVGQLEGQHLRAARHNLHGCSLQLHVRQGARLHRALGHNQLARHIHDGLRRQRGHPPQVLLRRLVARPAHDQPLQRPRLLPQHEEQHLALQAHGAEPRPDRHGAPRVGGGDVLQGRQRHRSDGLRLHQRPHAEACAPALLRHEHVTCAGCALLRGFECAQLAPCRLHLPLKPGKLAAQSVLTLRRRVGGGGGGG
eukprot:Rhum_TRINITY_DN11223_c0_g1::Rhum_TRINITY_DN11223_c0_g1_i1::g.43386::m.43386